MTKLIAIALVAASLGLNGCEGQRVNANSARSLTRSVAGIERKLPENKKVEFQVSFWSLKQFSESDAAFRKTVHGQTVDRIIEMGRENFENQKAKGNPEFTKYASWEVMVTELMQERRDNELRPKRSKKDLNQRNIHGF